MKSVIVEYATISPSVLEKKVRYFFPNSLCSWRDVDEDYFEFNVFGVEDLASLEDLLACYVQVAQKQPYIFVSFANRQATVNNV